MVLVMSEEQLKAAEAEAAAQVEDGVEEISEEDLAGVAGGVGNNCHQVQILPTTTNGGLGWELP